MPGAGQNPEYIRGGGVGWQNAQNTAAATPAWCPFWTELNLTYDPKADTPEYLDYSLWRESETSIATYTGRVRGAGRLDPYWFGWLLISIAGVPTGTGPFVFLGGSLGAGLLTFWKVNPQLSTAEQVYDTVITQIAAVLDPANGTWAYTFEGIGKYVPALSSPPTPSYGASSPTLKPYQTVYSRGGTAYGLSSGTFTWEKTANPRFDTPTTAPTSTSPEGLAPAEFNVMKAAGGYDLMTKHTAYTGSIFEALVKGTEYAQTLSIFDPKTTGTPGILIELPRSKGNAGNVDDTEARPRAHITGRWLRDGTLASGVRATLTPGSGNTYASS
jgi:hypothetical protein